MPDVREQLDRLRPPSIGCDLTSFTRIGNIAMGVLFLAAGVYNIVTFFTIPGRNVLLFVNVIYIW